MKTRSGLVRLSIATVFCVATFGPALAHAETGAQWLLSHLVLQKGIFVEELLPFLEASIGLEAETAVVLHAKIAGVFVLYECSGLSTANTKLLKNGSIGREIVQVKNEKGEVIEEYVAGSTVKLSGCITKLNGATSAACVPKAGGKEIGVIKSNDIHGLITLHWLFNEKGEIVKEELVQVLADMSEPLARIEMDEECSIGFSISILGKVSLKDGENAFLNHLIKHLIEVGSLTELWMISKTDEHKISLLGSAWTKLIGKGHEGLKFSGDPS